MPTAYKKTLTKNSHETCPYCDSFIGGRQDEPWNRVLFESDNFLVVPTLGAIVPGWLLVVPKAHITRLSNLSCSEQKELDWVTAKMSDHLLKCFGPATIFEHGPANDKSLLGCGVNHAHLHVVSIPFSLSEAISRFNEVKYKWDEITSSQPFELLNGLSEEYLFYKESGYSVKYAIISNPVSQFFRKVIANTTGRRNEFDYKKNPFIENVHMTLESFEDSQKLWNCRVCYA